MSEHTPGPWAVFDDHPDDAVYHIREKNHLDEIAAIYRYESNPCDTLADARLIAAAPNLLLALEKVFTVMNDDMPVGLRKVCYEAIAKAKGEEQ